MWGARNQRCDRSPRNGCFPGPRMTTAHGHRITVASIYRLTGYRIAHCMRLGAGPRARPRHVRAVRRSVQSWTPRVPTKDTTQNHSIDTPHTPALHLHHLCTLSARFPPPLERGKQLMTGAMHTHVGQCMLLPPPLVFASSLSRSEAYTLQHPRRRTALEAHSTPLPHKTRALGPVETTDNSTRRAHPCTPTPHPTTAPVPVHTCTFACRDAQELQPRDPVCTIRQ